MKRVLQVGANAKPQIRAQIIAARVCRTRGGTAQAQVTQRLERKKEALLYALGASSGWGTTEAGSAGGTLLSWRN